LCLTGGNNFAASRCIEGDPVARDGTKHSLQALTWAILVVASCSGQPPAVRPDPPVATARAEIEPPRAPPDLVVQSGHLINVLETVFSPDGELLATTGADETIKLWDVAMGREVRTLLGSGGPVYTVAFNRRGNLLVSGGWDRMVRVWDVATGAMLAALGPHDESVRGVAISPDDRLVAAGLYGREKETVSAVIWDLPGKRALRTLPLRGVVSDLAFSPDGRQLAVGDGVGARLALFGAPDWSSLREFTWKYPPPTDSLAVDSGVDDVTWSRDGRLLAVVAHGQGVLLDAAGSAPVRPVSPVAPSPLRRTRFTDDGALLLFHRAGIDHLAPGAGSATPFARCEHPSAMNPASSLLARVTDTRYVELVDRASCTVVRHMGSPLKLPETMTNMMVYAALATNPMYPMIASSGLEGFVRIWDLRAGGAPRVLHPPARVEFLAFSARGDLLAGASHGWLTVWRTKDGTRVSEMALESPARGIVFTPAGAPVVAVLTDKKLIHVNAAAGKVLDSAAVPTPPNGLIGAGGIAWSADGTLVTGGGTDITFWDGKTPGKTVRGHPLAVNAIATAGDRLAIGGGYNKWMYSRNGVPASNSIALIDPRAQPQFRLLDGHTGFVRTVAFDLDGKRLASGGGDGALKIWDATTGRELASFVAHGGDVTSVAFTSDGRYVASTGMDGAVRLWRVEDLSLAASLVAVGEDDYVAVAADGHYASSKYGLRAVAFRVANRAFPFEQFDLRLNRPDLVWGQLGYAWPDTLGAYRQAYERRVRKMGTAGARPGLDAPPPRIELLSGRPPVTTGAAELNLRIRASARSGALERLLLWVNDVPVPSSHGIQLHGAEATLDVPLGLVPGDNKIQISALDRAGLESERQTYRVFRTGSPTLPTLHVLAIGISRYRDQQLTLTYARKDAEDLAAALRETTRSFGKVVVHLLTDEQASKQGILDARRFLLASAIEDQAIVYLAGHGVLHRGRYYFLPSDYDASAPEKTGIPYDQLEELLDGIPARRRLMLLDTCHAGEAEPETEGAPPVSEHVKVVRGARGFMPVAPGGPSSVASKAASTSVLGDLFADLRRGTGAVVIAAAGSAEFALEGARWNNGVFTATTIEALRTDAADGNHDGVTRASELQHYVSDTVRRLTGGRQSPLFRHENLETDFPVR
jgi:WD40 repeat protein/uncharacterized caspase-like protein